MKRKSKITIAINKTTGKTIDEMSWTEIQSLLGKPISQKEMIARFKRST
jgi:hypothetical protein